MSWKYTDTEYIKVFRKMLNWEWYTDVNTTKLFLHCLLKANWKGGAWHGYKYKRGQFITSLPTLSRETGLTIRQVRTALKHLKATGEVTDWHDSKIRIITVNFYDQYQSSDRPNASQATGKRQASDRQATVDIRTIRSIRSKEDNNIAPQVEETLTDEELEAQGWTL